MTPIMLISFVVAGLGTYEQKNTRTHAYTYTHIHTNTNKSASAYSQ
jgi:hypothetical protein